MVEWHLGRVECVEGRNEMEKVDELRKLASEVGQIAYMVHEYFGTGLLEKVYETALEHRLLKAGYKVERQRPLKVPNKLWVLQI